MTMKDDSSDDSRSNSSTKSEEWVFPVPSQLLTHVNTDDFWFYDQQHVTRKVYREVHDGSGKTRSTFEKVSLQHLDAKFVVVSKEPFSEGSERFAYRFFEVAGDRKTIVGRPLVAIESRTVLENGVTETEARKEFVKSFIQTQQIAHRLAVKFNDKLKAHPRIHPDTPQITFLDCSIYEIDDVNVGKTSVIVENKLDHDKWHKFSSKKSNNTHNLAAHAIEEVSEEESKIMFTPRQVAHAFSHFSYLQLDRKRLVCDLRGVYDESKKLLLFSDPVIHCYNPQRTERRCIHGRIDRGREGFKAFFEIHSCQEQGYLCQMIHGDRRLSNGSNSSTQSEERVISASDIVTTSSPEAYGTVEGIERLINTSDEGCLDVDIGDTTKKALNEKYILAEIKGLKDDLSETEEGMKLLHKMLHKVCSDGLLQVLQCLVEEFQVDINMAINTNGMKETPLHIACQFNQLPIVRYLLKHGASLQAKQTNGYTPFHVACEKGYFDIVKEISKSLNICNRHVIDMKQNDEWTGLHLAARNGHANIVEYLIEENFIDANVADGNGKTSLHFACCSGYLDIVQLLVKHQQKHPSAESTSYITEATQYNGWNALHFAARYGHADIVQYLITEGKMDVNSTWNDDGMTSLHLACEHGYVDIVRHLLQQDTIDIDKVAKPHGFTPFHLASIHGHSQILKELFDNDPNVINTRSTDLTTAEHFACQRGHYDIVTWMYPYVVLESGSRSDKNGMTWLHSACIHGHKDITMYLVKHISIDMIRATCSGHKTALHYAIQKNHLSIVECFFSQGKMCIEDVHETTGMSYLQYTCLYRNVEIAKYLIQNQHAKVDHIKNDSWTALHVASRNNQLDVVKLLLEVGDASVDCQTKDGWTALQLASRFGHLEVVQYLVRNHCPSIDLFDNNRMTALHFATSNGYIDIVQFLLQEGGANVVAQTSETNTALHIASARGFLGMIKLLLEFGADINALNKYGETPLTYSKRILKPPDPYYQRHRVNPDIMISEIADLVTSFDNVELSKDLDDVARNDIRRLLLLV